MITQTYTISTIKQSTPPIVKMSQYDHGSRTITFSVVDGSGQAVVLTGKTVRVEGTRLDGHAFAEDCTVSGSTASFTDTSDMTNAPGAHPAELVIESDGDRLGTMNFVISVETAAMDENADITEEDVSLFEQLLGSIEDATGAVEAEKTAALSAIDDDKDAALLAIAQGLASGSPLVVDAVADMTDQTAVYLYSGSESGYTAGNYYFYNGSAWVSGGTYGNPTVDAAFSNSSVNPVQNKVVSAAVSELKSELEYLDIDDIRNNMDYLESFYDRHVSPNMVDGMESLSSGYLAANGIPASASTLCYTDYIPVNEGDVLRTYSIVQGIFLQKTFRMMCCYDANKTAIAAKGSNRDTGTTFTVPDGIKYVRPTLYTGSTVSAQEVTINTEVTSFEEYGAVTYTITNDFLTDETKNKIAALEIPSYECALPRTRFLQTIGIAETFYHANIKTPPCAYMDMVMGSNPRTIRDSTTTEFLNDGEPGSSVNGFKWWLYDEHVKLIEIADNTGYGYSIRLAAESLNNCSLLAIGDSTIDSDYITGTLLSYFASKGKTITLLGTLGNGDNKNEGRAGWSAADYLTNRQYNSVVNPFYNPQTETFDFAYYMTNNNYTAPDFVVLQLGINDLYNAGLSAIEPTWAAMETIIGSIRAYNASIKIILNLPTPPNADQTKLTVFRPAYMDRIVRYNKYALNHTRDSYANVRCSYCHAILDPETDISDNVHPTQTGYTKMAMEIINQINNWQAGN